MRKILTTVGFEIEGEWKRPFANRFCERHGGDLDDDGSIDLCEKHEIDWTTDWETIEYHSPVFPATPYGMKRVDKFFTDLQTQWRKGRFHWNESCGFHVHTGYGNAYPLDIVSEGFYRFFLEQFKRRFPAAYHKREDNTYCHVPRSLTRAVREHEKYQAVNMLGALENHHTIEVRLFPAAYPDMLRRYVRFTVDTINAYLKSQDEVLGCIRFCSAGEGIEVKRRSLAAMQRKLDLHKAKHLLIERALRRIPVGDGPEDEDAYAM